MNAEDLRTLFDYHYWALGRILGATLLLTPEQFTAPNNFGHGSLRGALVHCLSAERAWRKRLGGEQPAGPIPADEFETPQSLQEAWAKEEELLRAYLSGLTDDALGQPFRYRNFKGEPAEMILWGILMQLITHGVQHRAEAAAILTDSNHSPGDVDLLIFLRQKRTV